MTKTAIMAVAVALGMAAAGEVAAQMVERTGAQRNWSVFQSGSGRERVCFIGSKPTGSSARRGNQSVQVNRGDIWLMVANRPGQNVKNEVSMMPGYEFRAGGAAKLEIGRDSFNLITDGDKAWAADAAADDRIVAALRRGSEAKVTGTSSRGTTTVDTFNLSGFSAALEDAQKLCR
jgi:invasion protein IalB